MCNQNLSKAEVKMDKQTVLGKKKNISTENSVAAINFICIYCLVSRGKTQNLQPLLEISWKAACEMFLFWNQYNHS